MNIFSFMPFGYEGTLVTVEADIRRGIPAIDIIGLADGAVKETRERIKSAIRNSGFDFPMERVLMSLSPADLKKEGAYFDLALALAVLQANKEDDNPEPSLVMGELSLSGSLLPVKAIHAAVATAVSCGIKKCIVPIQNLAEAREVSGIKAFGASNLREAFESLSNPELFKDSSKADESNDVQFKDISEDEVEIINELCKSHPKEMRAIAIAIAGKHNLLTFGESGCGKTLALQKVEYLTPLLTTEEAQTVTRIHSLSGLLRPNEPLMKDSPFRMPHQTATIEGICGGGANCRPGEVSLSHNGVLFLDEAAEFKSSVLQMLRVPLESGSLTLSRAGRSTTYPARFQLLMAVNPCPCGNYGSTSRICLCSAKSVEQYWKKFGLPLLSRVEIQIHFGKSESIEVADSDIDVNTIKSWIKTAFETQRKRGKYNAHLYPQDILEFCKLDEEQKNILANAVNENDYSQRVIDGILKVARTIADIDGSEKIQTQHLQTAISLSQNEFVNNILDLD